MSSRQIVINVPEQVLLAEKTDETSFARELAILAAVKLYELGRLSSGRAAELAGMPRVEFLLTLGRYADRIKTPDRPGKHPAGRQSARAGSDPG